MLIVKERLRLAMDVETWIDNIEKIPGVAFVPVDNHIARSSVFLPRFSHQDPADRIVIATALALGATLITSNRKIPGYHGVKTL